MVKQEAKNEKRRFLCNECGQTSFYKSAINVHMKRHNKDPNEKTHTSAATAIMLLISETIM